MQNLKRFTVKKILYCTIILAFTLAGYAEEITSQEVETAASQWMISSPAWQFALQCAGLAESPVIQSVSSLAFSGGGENLAWHVALAPRGYIVMAADNRMVPVITFSLTSDLVLESSEDNALRAILQQDVSRNLALLEQLDASPPTDGSPLSEQIERNYRCWESLINSEFPADFLADALVTNVAPLLTTTWNQTRYYNDLMPVCSGGGAYNGHAPAGCGSIAAGQLFKYYNWPFRGTGSQSYSDGGTTRSVSLYRVYDWVAMLDDYVYSSTYPASNTTAISTFIRDVGYAMEMNYGCSVSASYNQSYADAANRFFFYAQCLSRTWNQTLASVEITALRPLQISYDESGGHMLVADGLGNDGGTVYFHINYGWGGSQDGWYRPTSLYGSASLDYMTPGVVPLFMPLFTNALETVSGKSFSLKWALPDWHATNVNVYKLSEGTLASSGTFSDTAANFDNWWNDESGWKVSGGAFFYCATNAHQGYIQLNSPIIPSSSSTLQYTYRRSLATANHVYIEASSNLGQTWTTLAYYTGQIYESSFQSASHSLSAYAGLPVYLRIRFRHNRGSWAWYGASAPTAGFYIDNMQISNCQELNWTNIDSSISASTNEYLITNKYSGTYYHAITARDNAAVDHPAPFLSRTVVDLESFTFRAFALTNNIVLRWASPEPCGLPNSTTMVRRATDTYPATSSDGTQVYLGTNTIYTDNGLTPGTSYYYTIWVNDGTGWTNPP